MNVLEVMDRLLEFAGRGVDGDDPVRPMIEAAHEARSAVAELIEVADRIERCAYAVSTEIDSRGYRWSEAYLDQVLPDLRAALARIGGAS